LVKKFTTKYVDLNLLTGVLTYVNKLGKNRQSIAFRVRDKTDLR
jgi:hypothetical protein